MIRTFSHEEVVELAAYASIPVINGLTDLLHPCQALADIMTIQEYKGKLAGVKMTYMGDGNNVAHSLMFAGAKTGMDVTIASPAGYTPQAEVIRLASEDASETGGTITITDDIVAAARDADVLYTDVWASMGQEEEAARRRKALETYQINRDLLKLAKPDVIVLHCLPAHRGEEVTEEVFEGTHAAIFDEAENRLHAQKTIMALLMG
ncbi:MAG TPA: ornithine carbamoyltransferase, partial [Clostridia bacterium]|nr:ornithine carbamoyltransferase [Clostridia bacterium]